MSHIPTNYAFLLFRSIIGLIHWNLLFFSQKSNYLRNTQKFIFLYNFWKGTKLEENLVLFKQLFLIKPVKVDKY